MFHLKTKSPEPGSFFHSLADYWGIKPENGFLQVPEGRGKGYARFLPLEEGLYFSLYQMEINEPAIVEREGMEGRLFYPISCSCSSSYIEQLIDGRWENLSKHTPYGIFLLSPRMPSKFRVAANTAVTQLTLLVNEEWLAKNIQGGEKIHLVRQIQSGKKFCLYEDITHNLEQLLVKMLRINFEQPLSRLQLKSHVYEFISQFIAKVEERGQATELKTMNSQDVERIFGVKQWLSENYTQKNGIDVLSKQFGMSESKLQKLFKHVFGMSIYQYSIKVRMTAARSLIDEGEGISEVGYKMGYSNLSHFSAAFKKQFGLNPKAYQMRRL